MQAFLKRSGDDGCPGLESLGRVRAVSLLSSGPRLEGPAPKCELPADRNEVSALV